MLRVQRVCGKSKGGSAVPLCIKLEGAVACGKPQHQNNGTGFAGSTETLERSNAEEKQPSSPLTTSACKSGVSNLEHSEIPTERDLPAGEDFFGAEP